MKHRHLAGSVVAFVLALAAFTGSALAGGGNGSGGGNGNGHDQQATSSKQSATSVTSPATGGDNSHGVKPSNSTKHDTYAKASSNQTKQYGNGKTAGQIATKAGRPDATLHGPGNSQPHKAAACPGGHEVDVHALNNKGSKCGSAPAAAAKHESKPEHPAQSKSAAHSSKPVEHSSKPVEHSSSDVAGQHVTICHATGSSSNPFVMISPDVSGVFHGHMGHQDARDIIPTFTYNGQTLSQNWDAAGQAIYNAGCKSSAPAAQVQGTQHTESTSDCTTAKTVTEQVLVGVKHFIGPKGSGRFVVIHPSTKSAHYTGKHPDDQPIFATVEKTLVVQNADCAAVAQTQTVTTQVVTTQTQTVQAQVAAAQATQTATPAAAATAPASAPTSTPVAAGSVKGATATLTPKAAAKKKPAGGVLGTTTRLGGTVASTQLPFTGLPLWIFVAIAAALILAGATVRRSGANRV